MAPQPARNPARVLAPVALAVFALIFFAVILSNGSGDESKGKRASETTAKRPAKGAKKAKPQSAGKSTYTVKIGDNLPAIARKTGVSVEKIQELNPQLDPYGLQGGQKIRLRE
jgi:LysM repeat protein